jgi:hypothetical protein
VLNAPIQRVWETVSNFHDMSWGEPIISTVEAVGEKSGTEVGAKRILNGAFQETLVSFEPEAYALSYSIDDGPGPVAKDAVANYLGSVRLSPVTDTDQTFIAWSSSFESTADEAVADFCNPIYAGLLQALKAHFE